MKKIIFVDMDDTITEYSKAKAAAMSKYGPYPQSRYGFYLNLPAVKSAVRAIVLLNALPEYEVWFLTAPSVHNPLSYSEKRLWIENMFGFEFVERLIICSDKSLLRGDYLIDDHTAGKGQESFIGELIHFGSDDYPDWHVVYSYFTNRLKIS